MPRTADDGGGRAARLAMPLAGALIMVVSGAWASAAVKLAPAAGAVRLRLIDVPQGATLAPNKGELGWWDGLPIPGQAPTEPPPAVASSAELAPFRFEGSEADRRRAKECLTQAIYYEAAREPVSGQEAVAQVILNRVRHPNYPKSICGVVFQGAARRTGCQFSFTCDGSLRRQPEAALWRSAEMVAERALSGALPDAVGSATHYHAYYVNPYWASSLAPVRTIGAHLFYRWPGGAGEASAFTGAYRGQEALIERAVLEAGDPLEAATLEAADQDPGAAAAEREAQSLDRVEAETRSWDQRLTELLTSSGWPR